MNIVVLVHVRFFYFLECVNSRICAITYPTIKSKYTLLLISTSLVLLLIVVLVIPIFHSSESGSMGTIVKLVLATENRNSLYLQWKDGIISSVNSVIHMLALIINCESIVDFWTNLSMNEIFRKREKYINCSFMMVFPHLFECIDIEIDKIAHFTNLYAALSNIYFYKSSRRWYTSPSYSTA